MPAAQAAVKGNPLTSARGPHAGQFIVSVNKSQMLRLDQAYKEVSVGNADIADVVPVSRTMLYVLGKKLGSTSLMFLGQNGQVLAIADLIVTHDVDGLKRSLHELAPNEPVEIRPASDAIVLSGRVSSSDQLQRIVALAQQFAPDKVTNLLTVGGSQQVMLQVRFAEVDREIRKALSISQAFVDGGSTAISYVSGAGILGSLFQGALGESLPYATARMHVGDFDAQISVLERKGLLSVLAEPNLVALSGQVASFLAGGEFPVPVSQGGEALGGTAITVEFKPFGVGLSFTPTVVGKDLMSLVLRTEVSAIDRSLAVFSALPGQVSIPGLRVRRTETTVEVRDGQAFAISGLLQHDFEDAIEQFPWLGDIPVIGALLRSTNYRQRKTELVVFITPRLVQPVPAGALASPQDGLEIPNEFQLFANGRFDGTGVRSAAPSAAGGIAGPSGYILK
jgi:pilus assembly protein CpaC